MGKDKLVKNVVIARSGIYKYSSEELPNLGLNIKDALEKKDVYYVNRPALILVRDKDKFEMMPLTDGHPNEMVDSENFKKLGIGFTGENVNEEWNEENNEVVLKTKVALIDEKAFDNYYTGVNEVSPGYLADFEWEQGKTQKGEDYDIVMTSVLEGNHLAMTPLARGGSVARILDHKGGNMSIKKFASNLWRNIRKHKEGVKDENKQFRTICDEIALNKDSLSEEKITEKLQRLKNMSLDFPESNEKNILLRYIADFGIIKEKDTESAKLASDQISNLYEKLDSESQGDNMAEETNQTEANNEETVDASPEEAFIEGLENLFMEYHKAKQGGEGESMDQEGEETETNEETEDEDEGEETETNEETEDEGTEENENAEDCNTGTKDSKPKPKKKKRHVGDHASNITMGSQVSLKGGLNDFFKTNIKGGKR